MGLSCVSTQGVWILMERSKLGSLKLVDSLHWQDTQTAKVSGQAGSRLSELLNKNHLSPQNLTALWGVSGPGTFTGIRVTGALLGGLSRSLGIPFFAVPTISLNSGRPLAIPLQAVRFLGFSNQDMIEQEIPVLVLEKAGSANQGVLKAGQIFWGGVSHPLWPTPEQLFTGIELESQNPTIFKPHYGYDPEFKTL